MKKTYIKPTTEIIEMQVESAMLLKTSGDGSTMSASVFDDDSSLGDDDIL